MQIIDTANRISYSKQIREMDAPELIAEHERLKDKRYKPEVSGYLELIEKCYKQITGKTIN